MKKRYLVAIGIISLLSFAIALAPATLLRLLPLEASGIKLGRLSGSLWHGRTAQLTAAGQQLDDVRWVFRPGSLFTGKFGVSLDARYRDRALGSIVEVGLSGTLYLHDTSVNLPASMINDMSLLPLGEIDGEISIDIEIAELTADKLPLARGMLYWKEASITVAETASLGNVQIQLDGIDEGMMLATLKNQGGDILLAGNGEIEANGDYILDMQLTAGNSASNNVKNSLRMFAKPLPDGSFALGHKGNIFKLPI